MDEGEDLRVRLGVGEFDPIIGRELASLGATRLHVGDQPDFRALAKLEVIVVNATLNVDVYVSVGGQRSRNRTFWVSATGGWQVKHPPGNTVADEVLCGLPLVRLDGIIGRHLVHVGAPRLLSGDMPVCPALPLDAELVVVGAGVLVEVYVKVGAFDRRRLTILVAGDGTWQMRSARRFEY
jgi:hypothetical protein